MHDQWLIAGAEVYILWQKSRRQRAASRTVFGQELLPLREWERRNCARTFASVRQLPGEDAEAVGCMSALA